MVNHGHGPMDGHGFYHGFYHDFYHLPEVSGFHVSPENSHHPRSGVIWDDHAKARDPTRWSPFQAPRSRLQNASISKDL